MDVTGKRVNAWYSLATLASQIYRLQRLVKTKDTERFQFQYDDCIETMKRMNVNSKLRKNKIGFYGKVKLFQHNETIKWRGKVEAAHVIIPPVSPHDETTNIGAAKVILSLLVMSHYGWMEIQKMDLQTIRSKKIGRNKRMKYMNNEVMQSVAGYGGRSNEGNFMDRALQRHMKAFVNNGVDN